MCSYLVLSGKHSHTTGARISRPTVKLTTTLCRSHGLKLLWMVTMVHCANHTNGKSIVIGCVSSKIRPEKNLHQKTLKLLLIFEGAASKKYLDHYLYILCYKINVNRILLPLRTSLLIHGECQCTEECWKPYYSKSLNDPCVNSFSVCKQKFVHVHAYRPFTYRYKFWWGKGVREGNCKY